RFAASATAVLLLAGGITTIGLGLHVPTQSAEGADNPVVTAPFVAGTALPAKATPYPALIPPAHTSTPPRPGPVAPDAALPASVPVRVKVPSIGVDAALLKLGKQANGEIETPSGEAGSPGGWYKYSPTPGQTGSAVILGHVNSTNSSKGLFYRLHELKRGQTITVVRSDHTAAEFTVDKIDTYHKATFPTVEVYRNSSRPEVRLITCGGYDRATGEYLDNTVVYATLTSSHPV
ncbi:MAG: class F sortase, partial [Specibacter sp.]